MLTDEDVRAIENAIKDFSPDYYYRVILRPDNSIQFEIQPSSDSVDLTLLRVPTTIIMDKISTRVRVNINQSKSLKQYRIIYDSQPILEFKYRKRGSFNLKKVIVSSFPFMVSPRQEGEHQIQAVKSTCDYYNYTYAQYNYVMELLGRSEIRICESPDTITPRIDLTKFDRLYSQYMLVERFKNIMKIDLLNQAELFYLYFMEPINYGNKCSILRNDLLKGMLNLYSLDYITETPVLSYNIEHLFAYDKTQILDMNSRDVWSFIGRCRSNSCPKSSAVNTWYRRWINYVHTDLLNEVYTTCKFCNILMTNVYHKKLISTSLNHNYLFEYYSGYPTRYYYLNDKLRMIIWFHKINDILRVEIYDSDGSIEYSIQLIHETTGKEFIPGESEMDIKYFFKPKKLIELETVPNPDFKKLFDKFE